MVLIISSQDDQSTNDVIDWLRFYNVNFLRISEIDKIECNNLTLYNDEFEVALNINNNRYKLTDFKYFWYRRSYLNFVFKKLDNTNGIFNKINRHISNEANEVHRIVKRYIEENSLNKHNDIFLNKLEVLRIAAKLEIKIPDTIVTNNKDKLSSFLEKHNTIITKNISQGVFIDHQNWVLTTNTKVVNKDILESLPGNFYLMLFQEKIEKIFELRVFYLQNKFYVSAIFSQNNEKTKLDFRNYDFENPNRTPPFLLPKEIENKLKKLMKTVHLNSGSIDLIVTKDNEFVFLEVNPIGQFSQVSIPCNYNLEKKIAFHIKQKSNGIKK